MPLESRAERDEIRKRLDALEASEAEGRAETARIMVVLQTLTPPRDIDKLDGHATSADIWRCCCGHGNWAEKSYCAQCGTTNPFKTE